MADHICPHTGLSCDGQSRLAAELAAKDAERELKLIYELISEDGASVTIVSADDEYLSYNYAIDCDGEWSDWETTRFTGDTIHQCLLEAVAKRRRILREGE